MLRCLGGSTEFQVGPEGDGVALSTVETAVGKTPGARMVRALDVSAEQAVSLAAHGVDASLIILASLVTGVVYRVIAFGIYGDLTVFLGTGASAAACFCAITRLTEVADPLKVSSAAGRARVAFMAWMSTAFFLVTLAFALKISAGFSRGAVLSFFTLGFLVVVGSRIYTPRLMASISDRLTFRGAEPIVIASAGTASMRTLTAELEAQGCQQVHIIDVDAGSEDWLSERKRVIARAFALARAAGRGALYIALPGIEADRLAGLVQGLRLLPRAVRVVPDPALAQLLRYSVRTVGSSLAIETQCEPMSASARAVKRAIDILLASLAMVVLFVPFVLVALIIKLDSPGPVIFRQCRNGLGGRSFRIFKLRTMRVMEDGEAIRQAARVDDRVTRIGRFLRRTSLDELPQLLNVLKGEMSLVGPRPHARAHDLHYAGRIENYEIRQHVKPGLTGWAQVHGYRGETPTLELMNRRLEFDLWYAANATLGLDLLILLKTLPALFSQRNAW